MVLVISVVEGCTDTDACNYNSEANTDDDSCTFIDGICETCEGGNVVDNDADGDGVCDNDELLGCTDIQACNYDSNPTTDTDNTLCEYAELYYDCDGNCLKMMTEMVYVMS